MSLSLRASCTRQGMFAAMATCGVWYVKDALIVANTILDTARLVNSNLGPLITELDLFSEACVEDVSDTTLYRFENCHLIKTSSSQLGPPRGIVEVPRLNITTKLHRQLHLKNINPTSTAAKCHHQMDALISVLEAMYLPPGLTVLLDRSTPTTAEWRCQLVTAGPMMDTIGGCPGLWYFDDAQDLVFCPGIFAGKSVQLLVC